MSKHDAVAAHKQRGNEEFKRGAYAAAAREYTEALRLCNDVPTPQGLHLLYSNRAAAKLKLELWSDALHDAEAALAVEPRLVKALYRKAAALQQLGKHDSARGAAQQALLLEPSNAEVKSLLRQLEEEWKRLAPPKPAPKPPPPPGARKPAPTAAVLPPPLAAAPWEYVASADGMDENLLLLLHGLGDRPTAFAHLARQMALPQTAALALGGPQQVPFTDGGRSWYTAFTGDMELIQGRAGELRRLRGLAEVVSLLQALLEALQRHCGWQHRKVHLLGFSQGGTVALELARQQQDRGQPLGSCVAVSAALLAEQLCQELPRWQPGERSAASSGGSAGGGVKGESQSSGDVVNYKTPVLLTHGTADKVVSRHSVEASAELLRSVHGMHSTMVYSVQGKAHSMPQGPVEMRQLMQFWSNNLSRRPTEADLPPEVAAGGCELLEVRPGEVTVELVAEQKK